MHINVYFIKKIIIILKKLQLRTDTLSFLISLFLQHTLRADPRPASDDDDDITKACDRDARLSATAVTARAMRSDTSRVYPTDPCARSPVKHGDDMTERIRGKRRKQANPRRNQGQSVVH